MSRPRPFDPDTAPDPEAARLVARFLAAGLELRNPPSTLDDFKSLDGGCEGFAKDAALSRRVVLALVSQGVHWQEEHRRAEAQRDPNDRVYRVGKDSLYPRLRMIDNALTLLTRRKLPIVEDDLHAILDGCLAGLSLAWRGVPCVAAVKQAEHLAKRKALSEPLVARLSELRAAIDTTHVWEGKKLQARIDELVRGSKSESSVPLPPARVPEPAFCGRSDTLLELKQTLGLAPRDAETIACEVLGADRFALRSDSPLRAEHELLSEFFEPLIGTTGYWNPDLKLVPAGEEILAMRPEQRGRVLLASCERAVASVLDHNGDEGTWQPRATARNLPEKIAHAGFELGRDELVDLLLLPDILGRSVIQDVLQRFFARAKDAQLTDGERYALHRVRCWDIARTPQGDCVPLVQKVCELLGDPDGYWFAPGEHWADVAHADLAALDDARRAQWFDLLRHMASATSAKPSAKWRKPVSGLVEAIGRDEVHASVAVWFAAVARGRSIKHFASYDRAVDTIEEGGATALRGLVWSVALDPTGDSPRLIADLLLTCVKKVPGVGPRAVKVGNACIWALGEMAAVEDAGIRERALGQLARLKARVTFKTTLKAIEKAFDKAAAAAGMSREDIEELGVPAFGFANGALTRTLGEASVTLRVDGNRVTTQWVNDKGKTVKSPPAAVKRDFPDEVKELKQLAKDAEGILGAGRSRLDTVFLAEKSWSVADWRERYLEHGLLTTLACRLIWSIGETTFVVGEDGAQDVTGAPVELDGEVRLWHPVGADPALVQAWRNRLEELAITQPFKQAHREIYLLTDAERTTGTYSNRFAAHILKQHQFHALCAARGWDNQLRLMVDDDFAPASRSLAAHGLRAEYWVEGVGDEYGRDTNDSGTFHWIATDQVRFYRIEAAANSAHAGGGSYSSHATGPGDGGVNEPVPLEDVPALVLSEVLRDVDLFVGVASVGNDPNWSDGGPEGRYRDYWQSVSFGDLSATAQTRKQILERLVPRLKIADKCSFEDRFLVVAGSVRTYKIHLGSGNILMKPNDEYLCIVPKASVVSAASDKVFLPFDGDRTMSIVLSKAFLLADDHKIKDATILSQIRPGA